MANEYLIPIGFDFKGQEELSSTISTMEKLSAKGGEVGRSIEEGLQKGAKASEDFDRKMKPAIKNLESIQEMGRLAGKGLADAFKSGDTSAFEKKINSFKDKLNSISAKVNIELPDDKVRIFEKQLDQAKDGIEELQIAVAIAGDVMQNLDPNSEEFQALGDAIAYTQSTLDAYGENVVDVVEKSKSMKSELRSIKQELNELESAGMTNSDRFKQLSARAGELEDQIGDTNAQIKILASDTKYLDATIDGVTGLVGAFTAVQGATALFGDENEELEKALLKVNGAMAILQGLQAVQNTLNKDSAFNVVFLSKAKSTLTTVTTGLASAMGIEATATGGATLATKAFSFALKTIGIGLIIAGIALLVEYWDDLTAAAKKFLPAGTDISKMFDRIKSYAVGVGNSIVQFVIAPIKALWTVIQTGDVGKGLDVYLKGFKFASNAKEGILKQDARNEQKYRDEQEQKNIDFAKRELERRKNRGEDTYQLEQRLRARQMAFNKRTGKEDLDLKKQYEDEQDKRFAENNKKRSDATKKANEDAKKRQEEARKNQEEANKKRLEAQQKANEQIEKFTNELKDSEIKTIEDETKKKRAELEDQLQDKIDSVEKEVALTKEAEALKMKILENLNKEKANKLKEFDDNVAKEKLKIQLEADKELENLKKDSQEKELKLLEISAKEMENAISEKYKNEEKLKTQLLEEAEKNRAEKEKEIKDKYAKQALKDDEERALLGVELASLYADQSAETELQKQVAIQQIKLDFAQKNLQLLLDSGKGENDLEVLRAKKIVQDSQEAFDQAVKNNNNKPFDMMEFLGIGKGLSQDQKKALKESFNTIADGLSQLTEFMADQYDRQMEKKQEVIDQLDDEIGDLEERLEEEKQLQEEGYANNVEAIEAELAEKQRQKDEEIRQQEELMKKKKQMQKAQMAIDTAIQLVNMITASTEIFKSLASIPFVGIPLAIATIGVMFGAFAAAKIKAFQSINDQSAKFRHGGEIGGKRHSQGGVKYYSEDGKNIELEDGEFVFKREKRKQYGKLLDAMNSGNFAGLTTSDAEVVSLFKELGFQTDLSSARKNGHELQVALMSVGYSIGQGESLEEINNNIKELVRMERERPVTWEEGGYVKTRIGSKTTMRKINSKPEEDEYESDQK